MRPLRTPPRSFAALTCLPLALAACSGGEAGDVRAADEIDAFQFVDVAAEAGIDVVDLCGDPRRWYIPESNGCGAAWLDHDGDGDVDLFVANGAGMRYVDGGKRLEVLHEASSRLYRNEGRMRFTDVTAETGAGRSEWINGVAVGDVDGDGDPDLYLACFGPDVFLRNDGGRFVDATARSGLSNPDWGASAAFADADNDGDLDLYVANYVDFDLEAPPMGGERMVVDGVEIGWGPEGEAGEGINPGAPDRYFLGDGKGHFREATAEAGLALDDPLCSYGVVFSDVDGDGWQDLLVANDAEPTNLFVNRGDGTFSEEGAARGFSTNADGEPTAAMGLMVVDFDRDGDFDVLRTNFDFEADCLHVNDGRGRFRDRAALHGLAEPSLNRLGWGGGFLDADCDGDPDLLVANGHVLPQAEQVGMHPWAQRSQLLEALPDPELGVVWRDATDRAGPGLAPLRSARGVALGDPDDDGDLDALIVDVGEVPRLLENRTPRRGHWVGVLAVGDGANRDGLGAVIKVVVPDGGGGERVWTREVRRSDGLYSSHDPREHFGLGPVARIDRIEVHWTDGFTTVLYGPEFDTYHTITESAAGARENR